MVDAAKKAGSLLGMEKLPEQDYDCPKHGKYRGVPIKLGLISLNNVIHPICPKCQADEKRAGRDEEQKRQRTRFFESLNIGERNWGSTFENFDAYTDELKRHLAICRDFANDPKGRKIVMLGNNGTGKNHLASAILKTTGGILYTIMEIELMLHQSYSGDTQEYKVIKELCDVKMLVIDEIGRTKGGDWELNWLSHVVDHRHKNLMPLVLISNGHLREHCPEGKGCPKCIEGRFGNDILSRINEDGAVLSFTGEDYRGRLREKRREGRQ
jgi:DNA replication protein DnaC